MGVYLLKCKNTSSRTIGSSTRIPTEPCFMDQFPLQPIWSVRLIPAPFKARNQHRTLSTQNVYAPYADQESGQNLQRNLVPHTLAKIQAHPTQSNSWMLSKYTHWVAEVHTSEVHTIVQFIAIIISESKNILWTRTTESLHLLGTVQFLAHISIASLHHSYNRDLHNELYTFFQRCFFPSDSRCVSSGVQVHETDTLCNHLGAVTVL
jgi:hypothetical protein